MNRILIAFALVLSSLLVACSDSNNNDPQLDQAHPTPLLESLALFTVVVTTGYATLR